jgi:hypothetical protein
MLARIAITLLAASSTTGHRACSLLCFQQPLQAYCLYVFERPLRTSVIQLKLYGLNRYYKADEHSSEKNKPASGIQTAH